MTEKVFPFSVQINAVDDIKLKTALVGEVTIVTRLHISFFPSSSHKQLASILSLSVKSSTLGLWGLDSSVEM